VTSSRRILSMTANSNAFLIATGPMNTRLSTAFLGSTPISCLDHRHGASPKPVHLKNHIVASLMRKRCFVQINSAFGTSTS
jgi:hypothetical protein